MGVDILSFILDDTAIFLHRYLDGELPPRYRNLGLIFTWQGSICGAIVNRYPGIPGKPQDRQTHQEMTISHQIFDFTIVFIKKFKPIRVQRGAKFFDFRRKPGRDTLASPLLHSSLAQTTTNGGDCCHREFNTALEPLATE